LVAELVGEFFVEPLSKHTFYLVAELVGELFVEPLSKNTFYLVACSKQAGFEL